MDEFGREEGVDYSLETWTTSGLTTMDRVVADLINSADDKDILIIKNMISEDNTLSVDDAVMDWLQ